MKRDTNNQQTSKSQLDLVEENKALRSRLLALTNSPSYRFASALQQTPFARLVYRLLKLDKNEVRLTGLTQQSMRTAVIGNKASPVISLACDEWRGIAASTEQMYSNYWLLPKLLTESQRDHVIEFIHQQGFSKVIFQGMPPCSMQIYRKFQCIQERPRMFAIWHGSFMQADEIHEWQGLKFLLKESRSGDITRLGFVKKGMAETLCLNGYPTAFLMNRVSRLPEVASIPLADGLTHIGVWSLGETWRKIPYAMLASAIHIQQHMVHVSSASPRVLDFMDFFNINTAPSIRPVDFEKMPEFMAGMHINLYVTLSECAPMLPLESLSVGTPCLLGPTCHYFEDHSYLRDRLVVRTPDSSEAVAHMSLQALKERVEIISAYRDFAREYNPCAKVAAQEFVNEEET